MDIWEVGRDVREICHKGGKFCARNEQTNFWEVVMFLLLADQLERCSVLANVGLAEELFCTCYFWISKVTKGKKRKDGIR